MEPDSSSPFHFRVYSVLLLGKVGTSRDLYTKGISQECIVLGYVYADKIHS